MTTTRVNATYLLELQTSPARFWTNFPGGLTIGGQLYTYVPFEFEGGVLESGDNTTVIAVQLLIANATNGASPLVLDAANLSKPITIKRVKFDDTWTVPTVEVWFEGVTGRPAFETLSVAIDCAINTGRRGKSPLTKWNQVMHSHTPPVPNTKIPWLTVSLQRG